MKNKTLFFLLFSLFLYSFSVVGQAIDFERFYGQKSTDDHFNDIQPTPDGGYVAVGESQAEGKLGEFYFVKFDAAGNVELEREFGTPGIETAYAVALLSDRYVIGGSTYLDGNNNKDGYLITVDFAGNILAEISFGGLGDDIVFAVTALQNGDIAVAAAYEDVVETGVDCQVQRYNSNLELLAQIAYEGPVHDYPYFILEDTDTGNILVGGVTNARGLLMNLSPNLASILWTIDVYGNTTFQTGIVYDENHYAVGKRTPNGNESSIALIDKNTGQFSETFPLPTLSSNSYRIMKMVKKDHLIYLVADYLKPYFFQYNILEDTLSDAFELPPFTAGMAVGEDDQFTIAFQPESDTHKIASARAMDEELNTVWESALGDTANHSTQEGMQVVEAASGQLLLASNVRYGNQANSNILIQKVQSDGAVIWESEFGPGYENSFLGMASTSDNGCLVAMAYSLDGSSFDKLRFQKLNADGVPLWFREIETLNVISLREGNLLKDSNGYFYFSAAAVGQSLVGTYVLKLDESGNVLWESQVETGEENAYFFVEKMILDNNQNLIIAGAYENLEGRFPGIAKIDEEGTPIWTGRLEESEYLSDIYSGVQVNAQGHIFAVTQSGKVSEYDDEGIFLNPEVMEIQGSGINMQDIGLSVDNNFYLLDATYKFSSDTISTLFNPYRSNCTRLHLFDNSHNFIVTKEFGVGQGASANSILAHSEGGVAFFGTARDGNNDKGYLVWVNEEGLTVNVDIRRQGKLKVFPTVSNGNITVDLRSIHQGNLSIQIYSAKGQLIQQVANQKTNEIWQKKLDISYLPSGHYYINISLNGYTWTKKLIKM